jgi:hypothetical protein
MNKFKMVGVERIAKERERQIFVENWTPQHDDQHENGEMAIAAACYAAPYPIKADICRFVPCSCREAICEHLGGIIEKRGWQDPWPWDEKWNNKNSKERIRQLEIAGALIAAEIDRLMRKLNP